MRKLELRDAAIRRIEGQKRRKKSTTPAGRKRCPQCRQLIRLTSEATITKAEHLVQRIRAASRAHAAAKRGHWKPQLEKQSHTQDTELHETVPSRLDHPRLTWLAPDGSLHHERELSAEQLIAQFEKGHRK